MSGMSALPNSIVGLPFRTQMGQKGTAGEGLVRSYASRTWNIEGTAGASCSGQKSARRRMTIAMAKNGDSAHHKLANNKESNHVSVITEEVDIGSLRDEIEQLKKENSRLLQVVSDLKNEKTEAIKETLVEVIEDDTDDAVDTESTSAIPIQNEMWLDLSPDTPFWEQLDKQIVSIQEEVASNGGVTVTKDPFSLDIVHISAEMAPMAKVGGLGDVVLGLARASTLKGHNVQVILPGYNSVMKDVKGAQQQATAFQAEILDVNVIFIRPADNSPLPYFKEGPIYGGPYQQMEAFLFFSKAAMEYLQWSNKQPNILHIHDWQTCAVPLLYWDMYYQKGMTQSRVILTLHNIDHPGECKGEELALTGLAAETYLVEDKALDERTIGHNPERLSLLKGGIVYSNVVTTVSPTYREESVRGGAGWLATVLRQYDTKFHGIVNGIDFALWDPSTDPLIPQNYSWEYPDGKAECKAYLQQSLGLDEDFAGPLVVVISRLVPQKGVHLMKAAVQESLHNRAYQIVLLGSGHLEKEFYGLAEEAEAGDVARLIIKYSETLAHTLYAAADAVLVPSMFEPCGLTQMVGMRYGAVPVVRRTGGLADTVQDVDEASSPDSGTGFVFSDASEGAVVHTLTRMAKAHSESPEHWAQIRENCMKKDYSWDTSAQSYIQIYSNILQ